MTRKPDVLCAGTCGRLIWRGSGSLPGGQAMCRECRAKREPLFSCVVCGINFPRRSSRNEAKTCQGCRKPRRLPGTPPQACAQPGCDKRSCRRGLCKNHARQQFPSPSDLAHARKRNQLKNHVRRGRTRAPDAEMIDRDVVGDRDGWRCGICRRKVDRTKVYPHPRSPSVDHVIPQSEGGRHTYANVRISHLACNVARSDGGGNEQLALIG